MDYRPHIHLLPFLLWLMLMKQNPKKQLLTFGDLVADAYAICGRQKAGRVLRYVINARRITFPGRLRYRIL